MYFAILTVMWAVIWTGGVWYLYTRRTRGPLWCRLGLKSRIAIIALAALVWPGVLSSRSTHVAATKTPTSLGPSKDAQTVQRNGDEPAYGDSNSSQLARISKATRGPLL